MERKRISDNHGRMVIIKDASFVVWDRDEKDFVETGCITSGEGDSSLNHFRDLYNMARKHGLKTALAYDWDATKADFRQMKAEMALAMSNPLEIPASRYIH